MYERREQARKLATSVHDRRVVGATAGAINVRVHGKREVFPIINGGTTGNAFIRWTPIFSRWICAT